MLQRLVYFVSKRHWASDLFVVKMSSMFLLGSFFGRKIFVSFWSVAYFAYTVLAAASKQNAELPVWFLIAYAVIVQLVLQFTILVHEFGHGLATEYLGGKIDHILLWPFGGICFINMPAAVTAKEGIFNNLKVTAAGPVTHIFMAPMWILLFHLCFPQVDDWASLLNPFAALPHMHGESHTQLLGYMVLVQAVRLNVMLFCFNMLFPMYPLDCSKVLITSLQGFLSFTRDTSASILLAVSFACGLLFLGYGIYLISAAADINSGLVVMLGMMSLMETVQIRQLMQSGRLEEHPLFRHDINEDLEQNRRFSR